MTHAKTSGRFPLQMVALVVLTITAIAAGSVLVHDLQNDRNTAAPAVAKKPVTTTTAMAGMAGMSGMGNASSGVMTVKQASLPIMQTSGAMPTAMAMVPLGHATWQDMKIQAQTSAPATFALFNGTTQQFVRPTTKTSFHLMVTLSDAATGVAIPYSSVWATVSKGGKVVFDERLWPMVSRYMGPHYGNNVVLPSAGMYHLSLLVSPPVAARHLEYKNMWLKPHKVNLMFRWVPKV